MQCCCFEKTSTKSIRSGRDLPSHSTQTGNRLEAVDEGGEVVGETSGEAKFSDVEEGVEDGAHHHGGVNGVGGGFAIAFVGGADDLAHAETSAGEGECAESGPVVAATFFIDGGGASKVSGDDEEDFFGESAVGDVGQEGVEGFVEGGAKHVHAFDHAGIVAIGMHVPTGTVDGDKSSSGLDEAAGEKHLVAKGGLAEDFVADGHVAGVVEFDEAAVFCGKVEGFGGTAHEEVVGPLMKLVGRFELAGGIHVAAEAIENVKEMAAIFKAAFGKVELHVCGQPAFGRGFRASGFGKCGVRLPKDVSGFKLIGGEGIAELAWPGAFDDTGFFFSVLAVNFWRDQELESGHPGLLMVGSTKFGVDGADALPSHAVSLRICTSGKNVHMGLSMAANGMIKGADDGHFVSMFGQKGKGASEGDSGKGGLDLAGHAGVGRGSIHVGVEGLDVAGTSGEIEEHDRFVLHVIFPSFQSVSFAGQKPWELKSGKP